MLNKNAAPLNIRKKAWLFDFILGSFIQSLFFYNLLLETLKVGNEITTGLIAFLGIFIYWVIIPFLNNGKTIGMFLFRLKIVDISGAKLSVLQLLKRHLGYLITFINYCEKNRLDTDENGCLYHDRISNTYVITVVTV